MQPIKMIKVHLKKYNQNLTTGAVYISFYWL